MSDPTTWSSEECPMMEEVLVIDRLCLRSANGGELDAEGHKQALRSTVPRSRWATVRRGPQLIAYCYMWPKAERDWFVGGLAIHPGYRSAPTARALGRAMKMLIHSTGAERLESHVLRANGPSLRLHRRLGFEVEKENQNAQALVVESASLLAKLP